MAADQPDNLDAYRELTPEQVARLVLCLLIEEALHERLAAFRAENPPAQPGEGVEEFAIAGRDVMPVGDGAG